MQLLTTIYKKSIKLAPKDAVKSTGLRVLKKASTNKKISAGKGSKISKGPRNFRGKALYNLTLIERSTCPNTCEQWNNCYGNNMPFAHRHSPGNELLDALTADLRVLMARHREGIVVRLHILGDFYSVPYVNFWSRQLSKYSELSIYGYTHRRHGSLVGNAVSAMVATFSDRVSILRSDRSTGTADPLPAAYTVKKGQIPNPSVVICPQQTGKTESCLTCGLCFNGATSVQFLEH